MEAKKVEATKRYKIPYRNITPVVEGATVIALLGYLCFPAIENLLQVVTVWFSLILRNHIFVFVFVNALVVSIYVSCSKTTEKYIPDLYDQYYNAVSTTVKPLPGQYCEERSHIGKNVMESSEEYIRNMSQSTHCPLALTINLDNRVTNGEYNHSKCKEIVAAKKKTENDKEYRRTRSEKKKTEKIKVEYRRTESEGVKKTTSWRLNTIDGLSNEEFRATVETFINEKKKRLLRENGTVKISG